MMGEIVSPTHLSFNNPIMENTMNDNEMKMIDTMAKAVGYQLALGAISDEDAYVTAWHYWEKFPMKINSNEFIQLVGYHRAVKELADITK